jgi:hypothetical protein
MVERCLGGVDQLQVLHDYADACGECKKGLEYTVRFDANHDHNLPIRQFAADPSVA